MNLNTQPSPTSGGLSLGHATLGTFRNDVPDHPLLISRSSPRPATGTPDGCWSRRPGTTAPPYRHPGIDLRRRWDLASPAARARGAQANRRLHARWQAFDLRKKRPVVRSTAPA